MSDRDAEIGLVGAVLVAQDRVLWPELNAIVTDGDFFHPALGVIWQAMGLVIRDGNVPEPYTLKAKLVAMDRLGAVDGMALMGEALDSTPTSAHSRQWARIVADHAVRRRVYTAAEFTMMKARQCGGVAELNTFATARMRIACGERQNTHGMMLSEALEAAFQEFEALGNEGTGAGVSTSIPALDRFCGKFHPTEVSFIAGRSGSGKTTFATQIAMCLARAKEGRATIYFSLEMPAKQILQRLACCEIGVSYADVESRTLSAKQWNLLFAKTEEISRFPIFVQAGGRMTAEQCIAVVHREKMVRDVGLVMIDHLQLMKHMNPNDSMADRYSETINTLKDGANTLHLPFVILSQFNRTGAKAEGAPKKEDMHGSGAIEQIADKVLILHGDNIIVDKNRGGREGPVPVKFDKRYGRFVSTEPEPEAPSAEAQEYERPYGEDSTERDPWENA